MRAAETTNHDRLVLVCCILVSSLVGMDGMMTTVALPAMADDLDAGLLTQQWIVAAFLLTVGGLLLAGGALGDVYGRSRVLMFGTAALFLTTLVSALAPNPAVLIAGRLLQGVAAAMALPNVMAVLATTFSGQQRTRAISTWSAWSALSAIVSPLVGGVLIESTSWRAVYLMELPFIGLTLVMLAVLVRRTSEPNNGGTIDVLGVVLTIPALAGPAFFLIQGTQVGWGHPGAIAALAVGMLSTAALVWWERRTAYPVLPLGLFRSRTFTALNLATFLLYGGLIGAGTYTVIYLQDGLGYHPAVAGVIGAVPILVLFVLARRFAALADRWGTSICVASGSVLAGLGILLLLRTDENTDVLTVVLPSVVIHGLGLAMLVPPLTAGVMSAVSAGRAGAAAGVNNAVARIGSMVAIAILGVMISAQFSAVIDDRMSGQRLSREGRAAVDDARTRPLAVEPVTGLADRESRMLEQARAEASVAAFHAGAALAGGLTITAGVIALVGARGPQRRRGGRYSATGAVGCPITGIRTHLAEPLIGPGRTSARFREAPATSTPGDRAPEKV